MRSWLSILLLASASICSAQDTAGEPLREKWDYVAPMKKVAARFRGVEGVVLHVGGSMTIANPYGTWARSGKGKTDFVKIVIAGTQGHLRGGTARTPQRG